VLVDVPVQLTRKKAMLQILGKSESINVRKVLWLCEEMGVPYEHEQWGGNHRTTRTADFMALNPNGLVPVIRDGDLVLWESNTICRYLAMRDGRSDLLPAEATGRARVEQWMDWQATELNDSWRYAFMGLVRHSALHADAHAIAASVDAWNAQMTILEGQLAARGAYVVGDTFTVADLGIGLSTHRWFMTPINRPYLPAVSAYYELLSERPAFLRWGRNGVP
jgi:glutathione S-transferase